jgi:AraC family transcriptional regulator of adaptative response/methylated-DNA-[protein]-cysteine methyltransferase
MIQCCRWLESEEPMPALEELAQRLGLSPWQLHRNFKRATGLTPKAYAKAYRGRHVRAALAQEASESVTDAAYLSGYEASSSFYKDAPAMLGMAPQSYRRRGQDQRIRFALAECSLGSLLVASTDKGVCCVLLGDDPHALVDDLQQRFAAAQLIGADARYEQTVAQVVALMEQPRLGLALPLDIQGTAFQQRVWQALQSIPAGRPSATVSWPGNWASPAPRGPWPARWLPTRLQWPCPVIVCCAMTAASRAIAGAWSASVRCCCARPSRPSSSSLKESCYRMLLNDFE